MSCFLAPTQTITNSYDDQQPTPPVKIWNKNNDTNSTFSNLIKTFLKFISSDSANVTPKQNGVNESPNKSSSSFVPHPSSSTITNDDDDDNLIIDSTPLPTAVSLVIEAKELNDDDQLEIVSSPQTKKNLSKPTEMEDTPPSVNELMISENSKLNEDDDNITDNQDVVKEPLVEEEMDTDQTTGRDYLFK